MKGRFLLVEFQGWTQKTPDLKPHLRGEDGSNTVNSTQKLVKGKIGISVLMDLDTRGSEKLRWLATLVGSIHVSGAE
jgi:hypothetical protein